MGPWAAESWNGASVPPPILFTTPQTIKQPLKLASACEFPGGLVKNAGPEPGGVA